MRRVLRRLDFADDHRRRVSAAPGPLSLPFVCRPDRVSRGLRRTLVVPHCGDRDSALITGAAGSGPQAPAAPAGAGRGRSRSSTTRGTAPRRRRRLGALAAEREHPPSQIASNWFPVRGPYSSSDPAVVRAQMSEIASIGVQTVIVSWWGPGSAEAARLPLVERAARAAGLRVAIHVEPFNGRTPATLAPRAPGAGGHGHHRLLHLRLDHEPGRRVAGAQRATAGPAPLRQHGPARKAEAGGFAGLYTYDVRIYNGTSFPRMCASARMHDLLCAPSVGPWLRRRARDRRHARARAGRTARPTTACGEAVRAAADVVTITSYNEWHEGTQIEPASAVGARTTPTTGPTAQGPRGAARLPRPHGDVGRAATGRRSAARARSALSRARRRAGGGRCRRGVVGVEPLEERDRDLAQAVALLGRGSGTASTRAAARPRCRRASSAATTSGARRRREAPRSGRRRGAARAARRGTRRPPSRDRAPANSATTRPSRKAFTAGMPLTENRCERPGLASTSTLTSSTAPSRASTAASSTGASA